ncbi:nuclease domain-containing protein [Carnobacterium sp. TMP28]|uniref:nuclease domain-containing protein n=1 Tax=Carnobacterium sp. TMP28 TaxID=3397060 RepID=UPI0039E15474
MVTPCKLFLKSDRYEKELIFFGNDNIESFKLCEIPEFSELIELSVSAGAEVLIKIEGFDFMDNVEIDDDGWWKIGKEQIYLYSFKHKITEPLIPGYYQVLLKDAKNNVHYSWFKINPKNMSVSEWELMKSEIEKEVVGLSLDMKFRNTGNKHDKSSVTSDNIIFNKITVLNAELPKFTNILNQIILNPKSEIGKNYFWQEKGKRFNIDQQTIKHLSRFPEKTNLIYTSKRFINYDINSNRELMFIITQVELFLKQIKRTLDIFFESVMLEKNNFKRLKFIDNSLKVVEKYNFIIKEVHAQPWVSEISKYNNGIKNISGVRDIKYNYMYKFYLKVTSNKPNKQLDSNYQLYWKSSALLYEIWGYLKILIMIKESGYVPVSGWIFDDSKYEIPFIVDGTIVVFEKDNVRLNVVYNKKIPRDNDGLDLYNPVYIKATNNKPDIRIDIFKDNSYFGSIVMDTKYRSFTSLWQNDERVPTQLRNYKDSIKSKILFKNSSIEQLMRPFAGNITPVLEVWVLFPRSGNVKLENKIQIDEKISFKEFSPTKDLSSMKKELIELINSRINIS